MSFSTLSPIPMAEDVRAACDNCEWTGLAETCSDIRNPSQRLNAGSEVPAGECPVCGCLAYVEKPDEPAKREEVSHAGLPPDPDGQNDDRADWAESALVTFRDKTGTDKDDALCDLIADLLHWCDRYGYDFDNELKRGRGHYWAETQEGGGW